MKRLFAFALAFCLGLDPSLGWANCFVTYAPHGVSVFNDGLTQHSLFGDQALALAASTARFSVLKKTGSATQLWHQAGAMGITKFLFPRLGVSTLGALEGVVIALLSLPLIAFLVDRHPSLFKQNLLDGFLELSRLFLTSPIAGGILVGLIVLSMTTGVVLPDKGKSVRNVAQVLKATAIAVLGGLVSIVFMNFGVLRPTSGGFGLIAVGLILGPWVRAQFYPRSHRLAVPVTSKSVTRRFVLRLLWVILVVPLLIALGLDDAISAFSVIDNRDFLSEEETAARKSVFSKGPSDDPSIKVASLSSGRIRYREMNPEGRITILGFHGYQASLDEFPRELEPTFKMLGVRGVFIDRPGIGPVSTPWNGLQDLTTWAHLVKELVGEVSPDRPVSVVGHSLGGLYALAAASLDCVRVAAPVSAVWPMTFWSLMGSIFQHGVLFDPIFDIGGVLLPKQIIPVGEAICDLIENHWSDYFEIITNLAGPVDRVLLKKDEKAFRNWVVASVKQGGAAMVQDVRTAISPWPFTPTDLARASILLFSGAHDQIVRPWVADEIKNRFAPHARVIPPFEDKGHWQSLEHWRLIFTAVAREHVQIENKLRAAA